MRDSRLKKKQVQAVDTPHRRDCTAEGPSSVLYGPGHRSVPSETFLSCQGLVLDISGMFWMFRTEYIYSQKLVTYCLILGVLCENMYNNAQSKDN